MRKHIGVKDLYMLALRSLINISLILSGITAQAVTLEDAIENALSADQGLRSSKLIQLATQENIAIARSRLLPQISLQGSSSQLTQTTTQDIPTGGSTSRSFTGPSVNHQLVMRQALFRPKDLSSLRSAELHAEYIDLKYRFDVAELRSRVVFAWIDLIGAHQLVEVFATPLPFLLDAAKQELMKLEQGDGTKDAVMEANSQNENAKANYFQAVENLKSKQKIFARLTNIAESEFKYEKISFIPVDVVEPTEKNSVWENLQKKSIELQMARLQEQIQHERVQMAESDNKPTLELLVAINLAKNDATSTQGYQYKNKQIGFQYTLPLYVGGGSSASIRQAQFTYESSLLDYSALQQKFENEFENNWAALMGATNRQTALINSISSIKEQINASKRALDLGLKTKSDYANVAINLSRRVAEFIYNKQELYRLSYKINKKFLN